MSSYRSGKNRKLKLLSKEVKDIIRWWNQYKVQIQQGKNSIDSLFSENVVLHIPESYYGMIGALIGVIPLQGWDSWGSDYAWFHRVSTSPIDTNENKSYSYRGSTHFGIPKRTMFFK